MHVNSEERRRHIKSLSSELKRKRTVNGEVVLVSVDKSEN
jgi:hypothetical protein